MNYIIGVVKNQQGEVIGIKMLYIHQIEKKGGANMETWKSMIAQPFHLPLMLHLIVLRVLLLVQVVLEEIAQLALHQIPLLMLVDSGTL